ncbi:nuclear transport factor 2 family protein [Blastopirellula sp. JC732]|uniref:Nuclear transport factor 2 family protein n=1 Tax=Blastopirellula sediminis TaxID=2894196 RepID=A0A9X1SGF9_9BACT|nr:nuclear transport factor 2 family protein [Blastopirellula sediminis]MCC9608276.1 nuclear transport factor 2 family protein [Blastopirellula sediminis]MCC9628947.1 nuclear transport factor 2 family protein [Blastopirellula sediminis]
MKRIGITVAALFVLIAGALPAFADQASDEALIRKSVQDYVEAFNSGNAKLLASMWSPDAVYTNPDSGEQVVGQEAIEAQFAEIFETNKGIKLSAATSSVSFISPTVAAEFGAAHLIRSEGEPEESQYTAIYVKRDGKWLLDRVTEEDVPVVHSNYEHLKELEWMIGSWLDEDDQATVATTCEWTKNRNFMTRMFTVAVRDRIEVSGMQIIGWDPGAKQVRSWVFDSDGGFGEGVWSKKGKAWQVQVSGTAPDGSKSSSVNMFTPVDDDTFSWESVSRVAGGELLPNVGPLRVNRQSSP